MRLRTPLETYTVDQHKCELVTKIMLHDVEKVLSNTFLWTFF